MVHNLHTPTSSPLVETKAPSGKIGSKVRAAAAIRLTSVCCCPPNLSRTLGMLGGYTWAARRPRKGVVELDIYLFLSATRMINGHTVKMSSEMPWRGFTSWEFDSGVEWRVRVPIPSYATSFKVS